ncbi:hypothetical protein DK27_10230 [Xanthomonas arboricola pv. pruni]|nr:hypothetical protein DK27_10230 [Xanthomonas arboricola pv. pruni]
MHGYRLITTALLWLGSVCMAHSAMAAAPASTAAAANDPLVVQLLEQPHPVGPRALFEFDGAAIAAGAAIALDGRDRNAIAFFGTWRGVVPWADVHH